MPLTCQTSSGSAQRPPERPDFCPKYEKCTFSIGIVAVAHYGAAAVRERGRSYRVR